MEVITALLLVMVLLLSVFLFFSIRNIRVLNQIVKDLKASPSDWTSIAHTTIEKANQQATQIVSSAETESLKLVGEHKAQTQAFEQEFQKRMEAIEGQITSTFDSNMKLIQQKLAEEVTQSQAAYQQSIAATQQQMTTSQKAIEEAMRTKVNELLFNFEENLASFLSSSEQKSFEAVNLELKGAKQLIESYKAQQLSLVDENIVAILERTLELILKEKLALRNQLDLVYESLEKAKLEKFFG